MVAKRKWLRKFIVEIKVRRDSIRSYKEGGTGELIEKGASKR